MLKLYNTLSKNIEEFVPLDPKRVTLYCCGPTVYDFAHIGNFRTYTMTDFLVRTLRYLGYSVNHSMNITDVGHLVSDADSGEDKLEKGARREGKSAWDIAKFYTDAFISDSKKLNLLEPDFRPHATAYINEQIAMTKTLVEKGYAYTIDDGIYFDTSEFTSYGILTKQQSKDLKAGARVEPNVQKKNPMDFALWKFSPKNAKRQMEWDSPWGVGFPGWHIECSAMSRATLHTDQLDIHTGGMDLIPIHHTNEIAQSEAATGKIPFVRYWVHGQFNMVNGEKMSKSKGNFYRVSDLEAKGFEPLALRYLYMTAHYRAFLNFTWEALAGAQKSLHELRVLASMNKDGQSGDLKKKFQDALENDLNMPQALAVAWEAAHTAPQLLEDFDQVLGLDLFQTVKQIQIPQEIQDLMQKRNELRKQKKFTEADAVRKQIEEKGFSVEDKVITSLS